MKTCACTIYQDWCKALCWLLWQMISFLLEFYCSKSRKWCIWDSGVVYTSQWTSVDFLIRQCFCQSGNLLHLIPVPFAFLCLQWVITLKSVTCSISSAHILTRFLSKINYICSMKNALHVWNVQGIDHSKLDFSIFGTCSSELFL